MAVSRRSFIQGVGAAAVGVVALQNAFGQERGGGLFTVPAESLSDSINYLSADHFRPFVGGQFQAVADDGAVTDLRLLGVRDLRGRGARTKLKGEAYSLMFEGNPSGFVPGSYSFDHSSLGKFVLLINPVNKDNVKCEAVINRLAPRR